MQICGQTLILIDNDATVSEVNQKIVKSTIKYMLYHSPENRAYCISTYGHTVDDEEEDFTTDINDLLCKIDLLEFEPKDSNLTDVLADTITRWREADFGCRDIVVFTDGLEGVATDYEDEELFYLIENTSYPIYIVDLVQENNESVRKHLSAIATTSEGKLYLSEFEGDDGGVDKQLSEGIFSKMEEYANREWYVYDEAHNSEESESDEELLEDENLSDESSEEANNSAGQDEEIDSENVIYESYSEDEYLTKGDFDETVIYEVGSEIPFYERPEIVVGILLGFISLIIIGFVCSMVFMRSRRKDKKQDEEIEEMAASNAAKNFFGEDEDKEDYFGKAFFEDDYSKEEDDDNKTMLLTAIDDGATRLLADYGHKIELIDTQNEENTYEMIVMDKITIGRVDYQNDCVIKDESVSKHHCEISVQGGILMISDLGSSNGTLLNGERITEAVVSNGDKVRIGMKEYLVRC